MKEGISKIILFLSLALCLGMAFEHARHVRCKVIVHDSAGYYHYLPSFLIYGDYLEFDYYDRIDSIYAPTDSFKRNALNEDPTSGNTVIKYTCGVALLELPAFLVGHAIALISPNEPVDGYSRPYQWCIMVYNILFVFLGLFVLRRFLLRYSSEAVVGLSLLLILFGTNLLHYTAYFYGMSHGYLFTMYALVLLFTQLFYEQGRMRHAIGLGLSVGMCALIRPTDVFVAFFPMLWMINRPQALVSFLKNHRMHVLWAFIASWVPIFIQMFYWKMVTGSWVYYSYQTEGFSWQLENIYKGLFSYQKGWLVYTPLIVFAILGIILMGWSRKLRFYILPVSLYLICSIYILFSWYMWYYGGSFGCRVLVQSYALLALPLAYFLEKTLYSSRAWLRGAVGMMLISLVYLNIFQNKQYIKGIIHHAHMNKEYYWQIFGKMELKQEDWDVLARHLEKIENEKNN